MKRPKRKEGVEMFHTSITLPEILYKRLCHVAVDEGKTLKDMMSEAVEEYVSRKEKGGGKR